MKNSLRIFVCCLLLFTQAHAASIEQPLADVGQEQTARTIFGALKCVVCEGQSLADSDAALAKQMRQHVRTLVAQGKSRNEILAFFCAALRRTSAAHTTAATFYFAPVVGTAMAVVHGRVPHLASHPTDEG